MKSKELKERFKPIQLKLEPWDHQHSIKKILKSSFSTAGALDYTVLFKDGQIKKIPSKSLKDKYATLIKHYEALEPTKASGRTRSSQRNATTATTSTTTTTTSTPTRRVSKRIAIQEESSDEYENEEDDDSEEDSSSEEETSEEEVATQQTSRGRVTAKPKSFQHEFYPDQLQADERIAKKPLTVHVPPYTDDLFLEYHSEHCLRCLRTGNPNPNDSSSQLQVGLQAKRTRLLLCQTCSIAMHNNCISTHKQIDTKCQNLKCPKCANNTNCSCCDTSILKAKGAKTTPFRCLTCFRAFHYDCIVPGTSSELRDKMKKVDLNDMYRGGQCMECHTFLKDKRPHLIAGERKVDGMLEYYVKWKGLSFRHAQWVSAKWMASYSNTLHRGYLKRKEKEGHVALSDDVVCIDRILDVQWADAKRTVVKKVLAVFKDTEYADAVWDEPPPKDDEKLYSDYENALKRYMLAAKVMPPKNMKGLIANVRSAATSSSYESRELKAQPDFIKGGTLMKHQMEALNWLLYQWEKHQPCILADDMGLGKTIQVISFLFYLYRKFVIYPFLIVVPNSTATNWVREFAKWAPEMSVAPYFGHAPARKLAMDNEIMDARGHIKCHVVIATYESIIDPSKLHDVFWPVLIVDESQRLKNDASLLFRTLEKMKVDHIILLTGTPMQNRLRELFNIMHFIRPREFQGDEADNYQEMTRPQIEELHSRLRPYFLRRTKQEVLKKLPPKYELIVPISMTPLQKEVYKLCLSSEIIETLTEATGTKRQKGLTNIFMNLRKTLNHPYLLDGVELEQPTAADVQKSMIEACGKLKLFHQMLPKLLERGHRVLLFSTMTRILDIVEDYLDYERVKYVRIDGSTKENNRVRAIDAFNAPNSKVNVFLLSTRAGGVGINLATADTVIIWDSDFNPYADLQAISRAHRIGQANMVIIYRFMTRLSVEEKILQIGKKKMALEHVVVEKMKMDEEEQIEDLESILKYGTEALFDNDDSKDIRYDDAAIDNLLNREQYRAAATELQIKEVEELEGQDEGAMSFSYAKVWQADGTTEELEITEKSSENESDFWEKFLVEQQAQKERKKQEKREAEAKLGRGGRKRTTVSYVESSNTKALPISLRYAQGVDEEFVFRDEESEDDDDDDEDHGVEEPDFVAPMASAKKFKMDESAPTKKKRKHDREIAPDTRLQPPPPMGEWDWVLSAFYQKPLWEEIVVPVMHTINKQFEIDHPTSSVQPPSPQYAYHKATALNGLWKNVHEYIIAYTKQEYYAEIGGGMSHEVAKERFSLKLEYHYHTVDRLLHQAIQAYIVFFEGETSYKIRRRDVCATTALDAKTKDACLQEIDTQHERIRSQADHNVYRTISAFSACFEQRIQLKVPPRTTPAAAALPAVAAATAPNATAPNATAATAAINQQAPMIIQYQPPPTQPHVRPLNAAAPLYSVNGQRIAFDPNHLQQQQMAMMQQQQMLMQQQQQRHMMNVAQQQQQAPVHIQQSPASSPAPVVNYAPAPLNTHTQAPGFAVNLSNPPPLPAYNNNRQSPALGFMVPAPSQSPSPAPVLATTTSHRQGPMLQPTPLNSQSIPLPPPTSLPFQRAGFFASSPAPSPSSSQSTPSPGRAPLTKTLPATTTTNNNSEAAQRQDDHASLDAFLQRLCSLSVDQQIKELASARADKTSYHPTLAQDSARTKALVDMNASQKMQLFRLLHWSTPPSPPTSTDLQQPIFHFELSQFDAIIAQRATIERMTRQFDDENIYTAISLLSKGHVDLFEKLSDAELLQFFGDQNILKKLVIIFGNLDAKAAGSTEPVHAKSDTPVATLIKLISDSPLRENAIKLLDLDKKFYEKSLEERIKKYLSLVDSIKSLKMYTRIMKRLGKGVPQLNSPSTSASQSPVQQSQAFANTDSGTNSMSPATPSQSSELAAEHPQLSFPAAHLGYPQDPPAHK